MKWKFQCPKCKTEKLYDLTCWKKGTVGYEVYFDGEEIHAKDEMTYDEMYHDVFSCQCGYESDNDRDFMFPVEVRE